MSFSGTGRTGGDDLSLTHIGKRVLIQVLEVLALLTFLIGMGMDAMTIMAVGAAMAWAASGLAYHHFQEQIVRCRPDLKDCITGPKLSMYIAFVLASALTLMSLLTLFT